MDWFAIGQIKKSHGLRGNLKVKSLSGEIDHFFRLKKVYIRKNERFIPFKVESVTKATSGILMKLADIDTPEKGREYRGLEIWVDRQDASPLQKGEYYLADICHCRVYKGDTEIGWVKAVCEGTAADILEVISPNGETIMVPFVEPFVGEVDIKEQKISLKEEFTLP